MLVCDCCEKTKHENEIRTYKVSHGETSLGFSLTEEFEDATCRCGGNFVEAKKCKICGALFPKSEYADMCESGMEDYESVEIALEIGKERKTTVEVNEFVAYALSDEQINKILTKWVEENFVDHSNTVVEYLENDKPWFSDYIAEKRRG